MLRQSVGGTCPVKSFSSMRKTRNWESADKESGKFPAIRLPDMRNCRNCVMDPNSKGTEPIN